MSGSDVAFHCSDALLGDERLSVGERVRRVFGLFDLTDDYSLNEELFTFLVRANDPAVARAVWAGYRSRLETQEISPQLRLALVVAWFEDVRTVETAFNELLGDDVRRLRDEGRLIELAAGPSHWRTAHVLEASGPVPWSCKRDVYAAVATLPELAPALFQALLRCYHNIYGALEPVEALTLLDRLDLPSDLEHLAPLRVVLSAGARNHYRSPELWEAALGDH
ncbi:hypothetical protein [Actinoplanes regularis]|uniref:Uncharacterized protein n=1 Tax=Actinoplanes regularis TaxID=52697 RepID=A0A239CUS1_9ACTN|nr:hypothetical protein [Actinoplanes regularis]SNS23860.1 hypothetical protein SAMN06264365_112101 [Actinoplanes regularis]